MTPLPRGECPVCHKQVPVRVNGTTREHTDNDYQPLGGKCPGSGQPAVTR